MDAKAKIVIFRPFKGHYSGIYDGIRPVFERNRYTAMALQVVCNFD